MEQAETTAITKREAPFFCKPITVRIALAFFGSGYVLLLIFEPDVRPGILEVAFALAVAVLADKLLSWSTRRLLNDLVIKSRSRPWMKWAAFFAHPVPFKSGMAHQSVFAVVFFGGGIAFFALFSALSSVPGRAGWPWVHPGQDQVFASFPSAMALYMMLLFFSTIKSHARWYNSLPDVLPHSRMLPNEHSLPHERWHHGS